MNQPAIAGLILCGGASRRMGSPKALLMLEGEAFLDRLIGRFAQSCSPVIVVLGHDSERIRAGVSRGAQATFVVNPDPERGMLSSFQEGLAAVPPDVEAVVFTPVDYPNIEAATVQALGQGFVAPVTRPLYQGRRGHPVCISRAVMEELLALPLSAQARDVISAYRSATHYVEVNDPGILHDIDLPEDYRALQAQMASAR